MGTAIRYLNKSNFMITQFTVLQPLLGRGEALNTKHLRRVKVTIKMVRMFLFPQKGSWNLPSSL